MVTSIENSIVKQLHLKTDKEKILKCMIDHMSWWGQGARPLATGTECCEHCTECLKWCNDQLHRETVIEFQILDWRTECFYGGKNNFHEKIECLNWGIKYFNWLGSIVWVKELHVKLEVSNVWLNGLIV